MNNDQKLYVLDRLYTALEGANCKEMQTIWTHKIQQFKNETGGYDVNETDIHFDCWGFGLFRSNNLNFIFLRRDAITGG